MELLAALVIIGILTAMAVPSIDVDRFHIAGAITEASTTMLAAQREAITRQHNVLLVFDTPNRSLHTVWDANNDGQQTAGEHVRTTALSDRIEFARPAAVPARTGFPANLSPMTVCSGGRPCLIFQRNGSLDREAGVYLTSRKSMAGAPNRARDARFIQVNRASGRPQIWAYTGTAWERPR
jgi:type II secretory pathway pseudopilin PulG